MATGHMNPAVSLALMLNGRITIFRAICYWGKSLN
jgi:glycerol uptake facilitator-like aquaporin